MDSLFLIMFLLLLGSPWILVVAIVWAITRDVKPDWFRIAVRTLPLALGFAPVSTAHALLPAYFTLVVGPSGSSKVAVKSILTTWLILNALGWLAVFVRGLRPKPTVFRG